MSYFILFSIVLLLDGFEIIYLSLFNSTSEGFKKRFGNFYIYINPLRGSSLTLAGYLIFVDYLIRIWSSYMIYNLIRPLRRFIS